MNTTTCNPKAIIEKAVSNSCSSRPVAQEAILKLAKTKSERDALLVQLNKMVEGMELLSCKVSTFDKKTEKMKTGETYWVTGMPAKLPHSYGRLAKSNSTASVSL